MEHAPVFTSEEAARVRGTPIEAGAKALVFLAADRPVHVVLPGARRVDNARLRAVLGTRTLRFATHAELLALTGCVPGAVPPFGNLFGLPVLVDAALAERQEIAFSAGQQYRVDHHARRRLPPPLGGPRARAHAASRPDV